MSAEILLTSAFSGQIFQNLVKIGPFSNCYIQATNEGKNDNNPSLESTEIGLYNSLCHPINFFADDSIF